MKSFFKTTRFRVLLAVFLLLCGFIAYSVVSGSANSVISVITAPFQQVGSFLSGLADDLFDGFVTRSSLQSRVDELEEELCALREQQVDYDEVLRENERLRQFLDLKGEHPDFHFRDAQVISRDASDLYGAFTVGVGSAQGVERGDPVVAADGLVGYIESVDLTSARVRTLLDPATEIGAIVSRTENTGIVGSNTSALAGEGKCRMNNLPKGSEVTAGDLVVTSGVGGMYPRGLIIGKVEALEHEPDGISDFAVVLPTADPRSVRDVMVITDFTAAPGGERK